MKKIITLIAISTFGLSTAQNTFPTTGNVGVGTTTPTEELEVVGTVQGTQAVFTRSTSPNAFPLQLGSEWTAGRRNMEFIVNNNPPTSASAQLQFLMTDENAKWRYGVIFSPSNSTMSFNDHNGSEIFKVNQGDLGTNKMYLHLPKADSRIVIGQYGTYKLDHKFVVANGSALIEGDIFTDSNIGIGTTNVGGVDNWKLAVNGKIRAKEIKVETSWSDFVFESDYKLPTLEEVEEHIQKNGHLKDIPSAKEVEENGVLLGEMDSKLLQKIEELTLYMIEMNKKIQKLEKENKVLKEKVTQLKK